MSTPTHQTGSRTPNRLIHETSPYLLQHAYNAVDWYPWGEAALALARQSDRPIRCQPPKLKKAMYGEGFTIRRLR